MPHTPTIYFMHGFIASGKTTFSKKLAAEKNIKRFNIDDMIVEHFGNASQNTMERWNEMHDKLWKIVESEIKAGRDVIIDLGHWSRASRDLVRKNAKDIGADHLFYNIVCSEETALKRLRLRNSENPDYYLDEKLFHERKNKVDPMGADENFITIDNN